MNRHVAGRQPRSSWWIGAASVISVVTAILLITGFILAARAAMGVRLGVSPPPARSMSPSGSIQNGTTASIKTIRLLALGDSLTHGYGDATGQGYVGDVAQKLRQTGVSVISTNDGINGLTSSGLLQELQQRSVQNTVIESNFIVVSIGGNDLQQAAGLPNIHPARIEQAQQSFGNNVKQILSELRKWNPTAPILLIGLYNPFGDVVPQTDPYVYQWNLHEQALTGQMANVVLVEMFDLFQAHRERYLYVDHFHPNAAGYDRIAERVLQDVQSMMNS